MKSVRGFAVAAFAAVFVISTSSTRTFAIEGLQITVQCPDVVLAWPSVEGETYIVQYRQTVDTSSSWVTLTNALPAAAGASWAYFVHSNQLVCRTNSGGGGGGGSAPPVPMGAVSEGGLGFSAEAAMTDATLATAEPVFPLDDETLLFLARCHIFPPYEWDLQRRAPHAWELEARPPYPWEPEAFAMPIVSATSRSLLAATSDGTGTESDGPLDSGGETNASATGFYQVVRVGIHMVGLANLSSAPVSDTILLPFEAGNPAGTLHDLTVLVDGRRYRGVLPMIAPGITGNLTLDTTFLENGEHTFQVKGNWLNPDTTDENTYVFQQFSDQFVLTVSNVVCFPEWEDEVGELGFSAYFAKTVLANAAWQIDIFDVSSNLVQTLTGFTTDGLIETNWNMMDRFGVARTNTDVDPVFSSIISVSGAAPKKAPAKVTTLPYPDHGRWVIAFQDLYENYYKSNMYYQAIYNMGSIGANFGGAVTLYPSNPTNAQTFPLRYSKTNHPVPITTMLKDVDGLRQLLTNSLSRNFYYVGHATANSLASYASADEIQFVWFRNSNTNQPRHYFRFVFLDACESATGALPAAFGINCNSPQPLSYFQKHGIRPRTFVGNDRTVYWGHPGFYSYGGVDYDGRVEPAVVQFLTNFEFYWYFNYDIWAAISNAIDDTPYIGSGWNTGDYLQVYGYEWLHVDEYNHKSDWAN